MRKTPGAPSNETTPSHTQVEVVDGEYIVERGARECTWFVRVANGWVAAVERAERVDSLEPGPGTVWERCCLLSLPIGALLMRVESFPRPLQRSPLEYLSRGPQTARKVLRREYRVRARGALEVVSGGGPRRPPPSK